MRSPDLGVYVDAEGPIDDGYPPFLGAHMANDPIWTPSRDGVSKKEMARRHNCEFQSDFTLVATRHIEADDEILVLYSFHEDEGEEKKLGKGESLLPEVVRSGTPGWL